MRKAWVDDECCEEKRLKRWIRNQDLHKESSASKRVLSVTPANEMSAFANTMVKSPHFSWVMKQLNIIEATVNKRITTDAGTLAPSIEVTRFADDDAYNENMQKKLEDLNWRQVHETSTTASEVATTENLLSAKQSIEGEGGNSEHSSSNDKVFRSKTVLSGDENVVEHSHQGIKKNKASRKGSNGSVMLSRAINRKIVKAKVENNSRLNKQCANSSALDQLNAAGPSIEVTCFDDDKYNDNMQKKLDETNNTTTPSEVATTENPSAKQSSEGEGGNSDHSSSDNAPSSGDEKAVARSGHQGFKKNKSTRKSSNGSVMSSQAINSQTIVRTKVENNSAINKKRANSRESDQLNAGAPNIPRTPSLGSLGDAQRSDVQTSPSMGRRRYTFSSTESQNNSEQNNPRKTSTPGIQNGRDKKPTSEITRKKPERIDLAFKVESTANSVQSDPTRKRSQSFGPSHSEKNGHTFDENLPIVEASRTYEDDRRANNAGPTAVVGSPPPRSSREAFFKTQKVSENSFSIMKDAGVIPNRSPTTPRRRISSSMIQGEKSTSLDVEMNPRSLSRSQSDMTLETNANVSERLNLASPPQARKLSCRKPTRGGKPNQLTVVMSHSLSKSETDLRKLVSDEEDAANKRCVSMSTPPRTRKFAASLGVSGNHSLSKSEADLKKLVSEEEAKDPSMRSTPLHSPRLRRASAARLQSESGAGSCPLSSREERKIYLAAAQPITRLPKRVKSRSDLQTSSQFIIDQAEKELDKISERLPHISMEQVMKSWQTDRRHWNVVSTVVGAYGEGHDSKANIKGMKDCRYIRESVVTTKKKKYSH